MRQITLGRSGLEVSCIGLGCMRLSEDRGQAMSTVRAALEQGITCFDHADIYGRGKREQVFSTIWEEAPGLRSNIVLQSKCGIRFAGDPDAQAPARYDFSYQHIVDSVEGSLSRLKTDYLDVLLLHRPDALVEPEEVASVFEHLHRSGKVRFFGVSNHTAAQIRLLQSCLDQPLVVNQIELNVIHAPLLNDGVDFNCDSGASPSRSEGTLEFCRTQNITIQAWSSLARGAVSGSPMVNRDGRLEQTAELVARLAERRGVSREAVLIAWLLRHPAHIQPIIGTTHPLRIAAACQADGLSLSREEWYSLFTAGRGCALP